MHFQLDPKTTSPPIRARNMPTNFQGQYQALVRTRLFVPRHAYTGPSFYQMYLLKEQLLQMKRRVIIQHNQRITLVGEALAQYPATLGSTHCRLMGCSIVSQMG